MIKSNFVGGDAYIAPTYISIVSRADVGIRPYKTKTVGDGVSTSRNSLIRYPSNSSSE